MRSRLALVAGLLGLTITFGLGIAAIWTSSGGVNNHLAGTATAFAFYALSCGVAVVIHFDQAGSR
jgi:hypothetical protein